MRSSKPESWELVARILERVVLNLETARATNKDLAKLPYIPTRFDSSKVPGITIYDYLARIHQYADCSDSCYTLAFIYIDRLLQRNPSFALTQRSVHRLVLTSIVLAIKYSDDIYADNVVYSRIGGVPLQEINSLEVEMLSLLQYNLYVHPQLYVQYVKELELHHQQMIAEDETQGQEAMTDCIDLCSKPIESVPSMASIKTVPSTNEMAEA